MWFKYDLDLAGNRIKHVGTPVEGEDATTKQYVDSLLNESEDLIIYRYSLNLPGGKAIILPRYKLGFIEVVELQNVDFDYNSPAEIDLVEGRYSVDELGALENGVFTMKKIEQNLFPTTFDYYFDAENGDDDNTGTSPDQAWKTLDKFYEILKTSPATFENKKIYFKGGEYEINLNNKNGIVLDYGIVGIPIYNYSIYGDIDNPVVWKIKFKGGGRNYLFYPLIEGTPSKEEEVTGTFINIYIKVVFANNTASTTYRSSLFVAHYNKILNLRLIGTRIISLNGTGFGYSYLGGIKLEIENSYLQGFNYLSSCLLSPRIVHIKFKQDVNLVKINTSGFNKEGNYSTNGYTGQDEDELDQYFIDTGWVETHFWDGTTYTFATGEAKATQILLSPINFEGNTFLLNIFTNNLKDKIYPTVALATSVERENVVYLAKVNGEWVISNTFIKGDPLSSSYNWEDLFTKMKQYYQEHPSYRYWGIDFTINNDNHETSPLIDYYSYSLAQTYSKKRSYLLEYYFKKNAVLVKNSTNNVFHGEVWVIEK